MLHLTQKAATQLKRIKDQVQKETPDAMVRLVPSGTAGFTLGVTTSPERGDQEVYYQDEKVLVVDSQTSTVLSDVTLDFEEAREGGRFVFLKGTQEQ